MSPPLLEVRGLRVWFERGGRRVEAVAGLDLEVGRGEAVGVVGESGAGKSLAMLALLGLAPRGARVEGSVRLDGEEILGLGARGLRAVRGRRVAVVFQDPLAALNPVYRVGAQIAEAVLAHRPALGRREAHRRAVDALARLGVAQPEVRARQYPHELSGGLRQRVVIAMAAVNEPELLIADEPTTALDATVQAQVLDELAALRASLGAALLLVTHDLGVIARVAERVYVLDAGQAVESGETAAVFAAPAHPRTRALLAASLGLERECECEREQP
ncbi:MAG: ABC transporter ATP-binding protein [Acidimicrobiales bacterium]